MMSVGPSESSLPGQKIADLGRTHVSDISSVSYNSNPPTSGNHFPIWAKRGVYDRVLSDGHLIHSLEHGYIVLSYNCDKQSLRSSDLKKEGTGYRVQGTVYAQEASQSATGSAKPLTLMRVSVSGEMSAFTPENAPEKEIELAESFNSQECKALVDQLAGSLNDFQRIIIVPRPGLDSKIALTAWNRLEKMNEFDKERIKTFIKAYHNKGPEKTVE